MFQFSEQHLAIVLLVVQFQAFHEVIEATLGFYVLAFGENWQKFFDLQELLLCKVTTIIPNITESQDMQYFLAWFLRTSRSWREKGWGWALGAYLQCSTHLQSRFRWSRRWKSRTCHLENNVELSQCPKIKWMKLKYLRSTSRALKSWDCRKQKEKTSLVNRTKSYLFLENSSCWTYHVEKL